jgi:peptide/nickel transport system substrate-binding protein
MFNFYEDAAMRERLYVPMDKQSDYELYPKTLPGAPGSDGPID